ncbi:MAG: YceI family protein, partial [Telluria sp.]|nr:YceI family protein [Telluria sp.]
MKLPRGTLLASLLGVAVIASAAPLRTDPAKSTVAAVFKQMNVPVEAKFKKFNAQIDYDAAKPDLAKATVEIETASLDIGDQDMNKEVAKKEWFNSA